jgi:hypothetical protein
MLHCRQLRLQILDSIAVEGDRGHTMWHWASFSVSRTFRIPTFSRVDATFLNSERVIPVPPLIGRQP